jgi:2-polyprenyl-6-methoxyphenol hydroxylase-like FAD-dependent oxidoreductase
MDSFETTLPFGNRLLREASVIPVKHEIDNRENARQTLVVGAGPTGLLVAAELARRKVNVTIIDKREQRQEVSKALVVQARTLEIMDLCGLIDAFLERGYPAPGLNIGLHGSAGAAVDLRQLDSRYPYMLVIPQNETEQIIEDRLNQEGVYVDRGRQFVTLRQNEAGVTAMVRNREGIEEEFRADYLIGCDGTHSTVRESIGMPFEGTEIDWTVFLADVKLDTHFIRSRITNFTARRGFVSILPFMGEYARIFAVDFEKQDVDVREELTLPDLQDTVDAVLPDRVTLRDPRWITRFRSPSREVPSMRKGRVFLAGDAAHSHTPAGGQGMNSGLQDAFNLGWRLAAVLRGEAPADLLDGYDEERGMVNRRIQHETDQMFSSFVLKNPVLKAGRDMLLRSLLPVPAVQRTLSEDFSNLGVDYTFTRASENERNREHRKDGGLRPGERVPDADLWFPGRPYLRLYERLRNPAMSIVAFVAADRLDAEREVVRSCMENLERNFGDRLSRTVVMDEGLPEELELPADVLVDHKGQFASRTGAKHGSLLLIRPDGYVAFHRSGWASGTVLAGIESWLTGTTVEVAR